MTSDDATPDLAEGTTYTTESTLARQIVAERDGYPAHRRQSEGEGDRGHLRLVFDGSAAGTTGDDRGFTRVSWDKFEEEFEAKDLALVYPEDPDDAGDEEVALVERDAAGGD